MEMRFYETINKDGSKSVKLQYKETYDWKTVPTVRYRNPNETN